MSTPEWLSTSQDLKESEINNSLVSFKTTLDLLNSTIQSPDTDIQTEISTKTETETEVNSSIEDLKEEEKKELAEQDRQRDEELAQLPEWYISELNVLQKEILGNNIA